MNAKIIIKSDVVATRNITSKRSGNQMAFREQRAALELGEDFPRPFNIGLEPDQPPYPPGEYTLDLSCLRIGEFEKLEIGRVKLTHITRAAPAARAVG